MGKSVVHFEFWSKDPKKTSDFYSKVFDWNIQHIPELKYHIIDTGAQGSINGGIMTPMEGPWPGNMSLYIAVEDLDQYKQKIVEAGGKMIVEKMEVPNMGFFSLFQDPDSRVIGIWKTKS